MSRKLCLTPPTPFSTMWRRGRKTCITELNKIVLAPLSTLWRGAGGEVGKFALAVLLLSACTGNATTSSLYTPSASVTTDCVTMTQGSKYAVSGSAKYQQPQMKNTSVYLDLSSPAILEKPIRQSVVQVIDVKSNRVLSWGKTDDSGNYALKYDEPEGSTIKLRILARIYANSQNADFKSEDKCNIFLSVLDNTQNASLYAISSAEVSKGSAVVNITAQHSSMSRAAAPFSVLDTALAAAKTILAAKSDIVFKPLNLYWSPQNTNAAANNIKSGLIGTTFFGQDVFSSTVTGAIYILGTANVDTDEYDTNIVAHEFGHYLESFVYRSDSVGGAHSLTARVDLALAFSEAWGNFLSAIVRQNSYYYDSNGSNNTNAIAFDLENNLNNNIYNEGSVQSALWDIADATNDGESVSCPLSAISNALIGQKSDPAGISYLSFANALQAQNPSCVAGGLAAIHANLGSGAISDSYTAATQPSTVAGGNCRTQAYIVAALPSYSHSTSMNLNFDVGGTNNYCAVKWYRVAGNATTRTIAIGSVTSNCNLDLFVTSGSTIVAESRNATAGAPESVSAFLSSGTEYVIRVYTASAGSSTCNFTLNIS